MSKYIVLGTSSCGYCTKAKDLLESNDIGFTYRDIFEVNSEDMEKLQEIAGVSFQTVPQIFKYKEGGGVAYVGGYTQLAESFSN